MNKCWVNWIIIYSFYFNNSFTCHGIILTSKVEMSIIMILINNLILTPFNYVVHLISRHVGKFIFFVFWWNKTSADSGRTQFLINSCLKWPFSKSLCIFRCNREQKVWTYFTNAIQKCRHGGCKLQSV